ncbi:ABC transporter ATP-binding protein [Paenibacillus silagei]|uniref:Lipopolysaccharide transport system ATP-binding protein n=1 Tax=Paenibacillus silagei TaxID=1670801 RepID=A0ABS4NIM5_9BACL|nr:ABC transporter ATP-binding protein [Paenibacillus silagei]MBP2109888.1 lipopolysaccharide transport system ATP-binding protein [Paenibacillus silagei]
MSDNIISLKNLSKTYKLYNTPLDRLKESLNPFGKKYSHSFYALNNISFDVKKGETIGVVGKNGSGKSTLLKIITGVLLQSSGTLEMKSDKISSILELGAGFNMEYTGIENIYLNGTLLGYKKNEIDAKMEQILAFADIGEFIKQPVKMYSSGMFARLAFAVAVNVEPEILIVDEALAVGDIKFQTKCFNKFRELRDKGVTILFVSHDVYSIRQFCDRAVWINEGELKMIGDTVEVTSRYVEFMNTIDYKETSIIENNVLEPIEEIEVEKSDFNAVNRWGSDQGAIVYAALINKVGKETDLIYLGEEIKVRVIFKIPKEADVNFFSCAFSIKSVQGMDLIVSTTRDTDGIIFEDSMKERYLEAVFIFNNWLNSADYILNVALENREEQVPEYIDYIEGAVYFKSMNDQKQFGFFNLPVQQKLQLIQGRGE